MPRNVNPVNAKNPAATHGSCYEYGGTDYYKSACPRLNRAQGPSRHCPNQPLAIDRGQGRGNNGIEQSDLEFSYEIEIASGQLVKIDKVIKGCKLEIKGLPPIREIEFRIELTPRAIPVVKSPYRLEPSEMGKLSGQLKEL
nr:putative reverse transcriptase domain-containing protein [Tanacetum cinerariifolium]